MCAIARDRISEAGLFLALTLSEIRERTVLFSRIRFCSCLPRLCVGLLLAYLADRAWAVEEGQPTTQKSNTAAKPLAAVLPPAKWQRVESSVDRALSWLASQETSSGAFPTYPSGQPAVTSLCTMAFLSRGHQPGVGAYGQGITKAIDFVLSCQRSDGLFSYEEPGGGHQEKQASQR